MTKETSLSNVHDYFSHATHSAADIIDKVLKSHQFPEPNLNDLVYFYSIFLRLMMSRLDANKFDILFHHLREVLQIAAADGKTLGDLLMYAKIATQDDRKQAIQMMIDCLDGKGGSTDDRLFLEVVKQTRSVGMVNDGLWKLNNEVLYSDALEEEMASSLNDLLDEKINESRWIKIKHENIHEYLEITFFACAAIHLGVMIGYASVLYHQSVSRMIDKVINKISEKAYEIPSLVHSFQ